MIHYTIQMIAVSCSSQPLQTSFTTRDAIHEARVLVLNWKMIRDTLYIFISVLKLNAWQGWRVYRKVCVCVCEVRILKSVQLDALSRVSVAWVCCSLATNFPPIMTSCTCYTYTYMEVHVYVYTCVFVTETDWQSVWRWSR